MDARALALGESADMVLQSPAWETAFSKVEEDIVNQFLTIPADSPTLSTDLVVLRKNLEALHSVRGVLEDLVSSYREIAAPHDTER